MSDPVFTISRSFGAPLSLVWDMYAKKEHLARWWGPKGFTWVSGELDFRPGGIFHYGMRSPTGEVMWGRFHYREIVPKTRLVFTSAFSDEAGAVTRAPFASNFPREVLNTIRFSESAGRTTLDLTGTPFEASEDEKSFFASMFPSMNQGFTGTLNQLEEYLGELA